MMENPSSEEEKLLKDIRNLFRLGKKLNDTVIEVIKNLFRLKKKLKELKI